MKSYMATSSHFHFTGDIRVQTMQRQAGIFIGERNNAIGWSTHGKDNRIIGEISGQANVLFHNILILNDPDFIDTPIDDRDINLSFENQGAEEHSTSLTMESLNVNSMFNNSSVFLGKGHITGMDANQKSNYSQGPIYGNENQFLQNILSTNDQDVVDGIMEDQDIKISTIKGK